ncbi:hypothetical protein R1sor_021679 [Riccia sorocarpa]|uniref:Uncharacterized protein n=1 Tax=Riccia sorocarpa TaxID=122646 RepID=A0ABD3GHS1_9MARC
MTARPVGITTLIKWIPYDDKDPHGRGHDDHGEDDHELDSDPRRLKTPGVTIDMPATPAGIHWKEFNGHMVVVMKKVILTMIAVLIMTRIPMLMMVNIDMPATPAGLQWKEFNRHMVAVTTVMMTMVLTTMIALLIMTRIPMLMMVNIEMPTTPAGLQWKEFNGHMVAVTMVMISMVLTNMNMMATIAALRQTNRDDNDDRYYGDAMMRAILILATPTGLQWKEFNGHMVVVITVMMATSADLKRVWGCRKSETFAKVKGIVLVVRKRERLDGNFAVAVNSLD